MAENITKILVTDEEKGTLKGKIALASTEIANPTAICNACSCDCVCICDCDSYKGDIYNPNKGLYQEQK